MFDTAIRWRFTVVLVHCSTVQHIGVATTGSYRSPMHRDNVMHQSSLFFACSAFSRFFSAMRSSICLLRSAGERTDLPFFPSLSYPGWPILLGSVPSPPGVALLLRFGVWACAPRFLISSAACFL